MRCYPAYFGFPDAAQAARPLQVQATWQLRRQLRHPMQYRCVKTAHYVAALRRRSPQQRNCRRHRLYRFQFEIHPGAPPVVAQHLFQRGQLRLQPPQAAQRVVGHGKLVAIKVQFRIVLDRNPSVGGVTQVQFQSIAAARQCTVKCRERIFPLLPAGATMSPVPQQPY